MEKRIVQGFEFKVESDSHFVIPDCNMAKFNKLFNRIEKKISKLSAGSLSVVHVQDHNRFKDLKDGTRMDYVFHEYIIKGEAPCVNGWELIGVIERQHSEPVFRSVPGKEIPVSYRESSATCEHCNTARYRKQNFVMMNTESGKYKLIGRNCLSDFLGGMDPNRVAVHLEWASELQDIATDEPNEKSWGIKKTYISQFLTITAIAIRVYGWVSVKAANAYNDTIDDDDDDDDRNMMESTSMRVMQQMNARPKYSDEKLENATDADKQMVEDAKAWIMGLDDDSEYVQNLKIIVNDEYIVDREFGLAVSLIGSYQRHLEREANIKHDEKAKQESKWFGQIKKREEFVLTLSGTHEFGTEWGTTTIHRFTDEGGNIAVWFASNGSEMEIGQTYKVKATVKDHDDYKGTQQTILNRVAMLEMITA